MKYIITFVAALLLLGCSQEQKSSSTTAAVTTKKAAPVKKVEVAKVEATEVEKVIAKAPAEAPVVEEKVADVLPVVAVSSFDAVGTFKRKCGGCHGANGEKAALGKSQIITGWEVVKTAEALNGYKDGSYGGAMKGLMASQVSSLSESDINALAKHISEL